MSKIVTDSQHYTDIANAIREKNGTETTYKPSEMAEAIQGIQSGGADFSELEYKLSNGYTDYNSFFEGMAQMSEVPEEILQHVANGTDFTRMFYACSSLTSLPKLVLTNASDMQQFCRDCTNLTTVDEVIAPNCFRWQQAFYGCKKLTSISRVDTSGATQAGALFSECNELIAVPDGLDMSKCTSFSSMFYRCWKLSVIPELDTRNCTDFRNAFSECRVLETIHGIDFSSATSVVSTFNYCAKLKNITINGVIKITGLSFSASPLLTHDSLMSIINALYDYVSEGTTGTYTLTLGSTNLAKLTDAEKAIATQKGWTLA